MYKFIFVLLVVVGMATASNAQEKQNMKQSNNKPLVALFLGDRNYGTCS